jgi:hypothetical protein
MPFLDGRGRILGIGGTPFRGSLSRPPPYLLALVVVWRAARRWPWLMILAG